MMTFDEVLSHFGVTPKQNVRTVNVKCPAHEDREPSLSLSVGNEGRTILYCHAGCPPDSVLAAAGLTWGDIQPNDSTWTPARHVNGRKDSPEPRPEPLPDFWADERRKMLQVAQERLKDEPDHALLAMIRTRDGIEAVTLERFGCGILTQYGRDWLVFPYPTGAQLYRREGGRKAISSVKGSAVKPSFFGETKLTGETELYIAKSAREAMLLWQEFGLIDVLGLPGGEKPELSVTQAAMLRAIASGYESIRTILDTDTDAARATAEAFARAVAAVVHPVALGMVDVTTATGGEHKDLTDVFRAEGAEGMADVLAHGKMIEVREPATPPDPLSKAPTIPAAVYKALPDDLREACELLRPGHERDVFLSGQLPCLTAALPNVRTKYARRWKALSVCMAVVAPAGSGKGTLSLAGDTIRGIDERLREESEYVLDEWEALPAKDRKEKPRPPYRVLTLPADNSLRALTDGLRDSEGRGLIFETEIKVLAQSLKQDWGDFKGLLLKAAEQEPYERNRREERPVYIRHPEISVAMSGTPRSFIEWMKDAEDGLYSRFLLYTFKAPVVWQSQFESETDATLEAAIEKIGDRLNGIHRALSNRRDDEGEARPLYFRLEPDQQRYVNDVFAALLAHVDEMERPELFASVKRGAFHAVRIAGALAAYRIASDGANLETLHSYVPTMGEVEAAVRLVQTLTHHASLLALAFASDPAAKLESEERRHLYDTLPDDFATAEAQNIGDAMGMNDRKVERALSAMIEAGLITRERRGYYRKLVTDHYPTLPGDMSEPSGASEPSVTAHGNT